MSSTFLFIGAATMLYTGLRTRDSALLSAGHVLLFLALANFFGASA